jgi:hypothetical protein
LCLSRQRNFKTCSTSWRRHVGKVKAQELAQRFPMLPPEWILRPIEWDPGARERFAQGRARHAFCPLCLQEMIVRARTVWIRSEWAFAFQTHSPRHRAPLIERCAVCLVEDPRLPNANACSPIPSCWKCGSALFHTMLTNAPHRFLRR